MSKTVIILGAKGRFGRAASEAFFKAGWIVRAFARTWPADRADPRFEQIEGDAFDAQTLSDAVQGCDVIVNALNPPYQNWRRDLPKLTATVIAAAKTSGATIMIPGNVYNYGKGMPALLKEDTAHFATTLKGMLREQMEEAYAIAGDDGVRTIILRGGDFIEREKTGNWFDTHIVSNLAKGRITYPGPLDRMHAWAYLPDMARAMVGLAEKRNDLAQFDTFGFEGINLTGAELLETIERLSERKLKVGSMPWPIMRVLGLAVPSIREVMEMRYLWQVPHAIDGAKLAVTLPEFRPTHPDDALRQALPIHTRVRNVRTTLAS
jgi:nucleoside-diphosphate-sugar epimerase